ncbi:MAG: glycosyltransferase family 4 protein [Chloroflexi bacterium]|nr:glycosyltransferase family 4 protein [Chloroflexota bacterium]
MTITMLILAGIERPAGRRYFHIACGLVQRGHRVRILALHPHLAECSERRFVRDGVEVWYVGQMHALKAGDVPARFGALQLARVLLNATVGMIRGIIESRSDVYHLGKPQPVNGAAALVGVMLLRCRGFYVDCDDDEVHSNRLMNRWQRAVFAFWQWLLPRLAEGVTVNTRYAANRMHRAGIGHITYVPNGVAPDLFRRPPSDAIAATRNRLGFAGKRVIAYVGTLALHNHPVDLLIDAFERIARQMPDVALLMIGGGEDLAALRQRVIDMGLQDRISLIGHVPQEQVPVYLALAELSVDPVRDDEVARSRSPLKLFESMALGVPVVTGDVGDRAEWLDQGRAGVLVAPGDARALADAIQELLRDNGRRMAIGRAAKEQAGQYSWPLLAARWEQVYGPDRKDDNAR